MYKYFLRIIDHYQELKPMIPGNCHLQEVNCLYLIAENEFLTALGIVTMKEKDGKEIDYTYCDVWRLHDRKFAELKAFVIKGGK